MIDEPRRQYGDRDPRDMPPITIKSFDEAERPIIKAESEKLVADYLRILGSQFYDDKKAFFQEKRMLVQAITAPARWAWKKGVFLDDASYRKILNEVIKGIKQHGNTSNIRYFCGYFLGCVQKRITHGEEEYLALGKSIRERRPTKNATDLVTGLQVVETAEQFTKAITDLSRLVTQKRPKAPKPPAKKPRPASDKEDNQLDLL